MSIQTSSGEMTNLKLSRSSGSGNSILHVFGKLRSLISKYEKKPSAQFGKTMQFHPQQSYKMVPPLY